MSRDPLEKLLSLDDPGAGPARPLDPAAADALVEGALARAMPNASTGILKAGVVVGALVALAGGAYLSRLSDEPRRNDPNMAPSVASALTDPSAPETRPSVIDATPSSPPAAQALGRTSGKSASRATPPEPSKDETIVLSDLELLGAANTARRERRWRDADALYSKVVERFPTGSVSAVAAVASGELRLDLLGDAAGARERFRFATTRGEAHAVDAFEGLFKACTMLGDKRCRDDARAALEARGAAPSESDRSP